MGPVTYEIHHPNKGKTKQTYPVNLMKERKEPLSKVQETTLMVRKVEGEEKEDTEDARRQESVMSLAYLEDYKQRDL